MINHLGQRHTGGDILDRFGLGLGLLALAIGLLGCSDLFGAGGDGGPPALESKAPAMGEAGVSALESVSLGFSRRVNPETVDAGIRLWSGDRPVVTDPDLGDNGRTVLLLPTDPLDFGTTYRVEVTGSLGFSGGVGFGQAEAWEFSTEGLVPPSPDSDSLVLNLEAIAHDSMRGRGSGSEDELRAAEYLRDRFMAYGLQEAPGGALQSFEAYAWRLDRVLTSHNVLVAVEGSGALSEEWIVVGAHYDHIGFRDLVDDSQGPNNGADDNGSGTVLVLEMARKFQAFVDAGGTGSRDRRSVLFALFGAEEQGLLGSCAYVFGNPAVPLLQTRAMMNFDMVGRLRENTLFISGAETSDVWEAMVANANAPDLGLSLDTSSCTGCTDHVCFWQAGIPFVGFFTGFHEEYHAPGDDVETINVPGMVRIGELALRVLNRLVVMPDPPALRGRIGFAG